MASSVPIRASGSSQILGKSQSLIQASKQLRTALLNADWDSLYALTTNPCAGFGEKAAGTPANGKPRDDPNDGLTNREMEVLKCVAEGYSTKQVAWQLGMSFKTAACHRYRVMEKLGIHELANLVRYAIRNGIVKA